jgi:hypothetical protein
MEKSSSKYKINDHLSVSKMTEWIVEKKYNNQELGQKLREYYWDVRDELRNGK